MTSRGLISLGSNPGNFAWTTARDPRAPNGGSPWYPNDVTVRKVDANSTAQTVTNSTSETTVASLTLPALTLSSTGAARLSATGTVSKNTAGNVTFRVKVADQSSTATVLATSAIAVGSSTAAHAWLLEALMLGKQPGVSRAWGLLDISAAGAGASLLPSTFSSVGFSTMGLDETEEWVVSVTAQMSAASTALSVTRQAALLEGMS